jgi:DNA-binding NarL/FixJ family response regulator
MVSLMVSPGVSPGAPSWLPQPVRVAVASDHQLVAEAVVAALRNRSFEPLLVRWPASSPDPVGKARRRRAFRRSVGPPPDVGLLLSDLTRMDQVLSAQTIVKALPLPWLVMAGAARGPAWGALYEGGANLVVPSDTGLVNVCDLLADLSAGRKPGAQRRDRRELIQGWRTFAAQRSDLTARLQTLTGREEQILRQLHQGCPVRNIAEQSEVTEATVRSQVKAILKKLDVNSQMAAVAAYENVLTDSTTYADAG